MNARLLLLIPFAIAVQAQDASPSGKKPWQDDLARARPIVDAIYNLDYATAEGLSQKLIRDLPEHPAGYVYLARTYWSEELSKVRLMSTERFVAMDLFSDTPQFKVAVTRATLERFNRATGQALEKARAWLKQHPGDIGAQYFAGMAHGVMAAWEFSIERNRWKAAQSSSEAFEIARDMLRRDPDFADARLITGTFSFLADSLDWQTKWIGWLLGFRGSQDKGRADLETAADKGLLTSEDARSLLAILHAREKQLDKALARLAELHERHPGNYLVHLDIAAAYWLMDRPKEALATYQAILSKNYPKLERGFVLGRVGAASRMTGDFSGSERLLRDAVEQSRGSPRLSAIAHLEFGKTLDLLGRRPDAVEQYRLVLRQDDFLGLHREAERLLRKPFDLAAMRQDQGGGFLTLR